MFNRKRWRRVLTALLVPTFLLASTQSIQAKENVVDTTNEDEFIVEVGIDRSKENPLTIKLGDSTGFIIKETMIPGDEINKKIIFKNVLDEPIDVNLENIVNMLEDKSPNSLTMIADLTISSDGMVIYEGKLSEVTDPVLTWMAIEGKEELVIDVKLGIPLMADNRYQDGEIESKWVFATRADVPDDPEEEDEDDVEYVEVPNPELENGEQHNPEDVSTGDIFKYEKPVTAIIAGSLLVAAVLMSKKTKK